MGGGQPIKSSKTRMEVDVRQKRASAMYSIDAKSEVRKSQDNEVMKKIYEEYIGKPGEERAHQLLHTHYNEKQKYNF